MSRVVGTSRAGRSHLSGTHPLGEVIAGLVGAVIAGLVGGVIANP
jgi:hypothetical protein